MPTGRLSVVKPDGMVMDAAYTRNVFSAGMPLLFTYGGLIPSFIYVGWCSTVLWTIVSSRLSANTFAIAIVSSWRASRYAPQAAMSVLTSGLLHWSALLGGMLFESSGDLAMSSRVLKGDVGFLARYNRKDSSAIVGCVARFAISGLRLGITTGSTTMAPAAFNSSMFF